MRASKGQKGETRERILSALTTSREETLEEAEAGKCQTKIERKVSMEGPLRRYVSGKLQPEMASSGDKFLESRDDEEMGSQEKRSKKNKPL